MLRLHPRADRSADGAPKASSWRRATTAAGTPATGSPATGSPAAGSPAARFPTVGRRSDVDRVYDDIFDAVMDRRLLPGTKLTEATLCAVFSCSRSVVRSALSQLAHDKIVIIEPNRGAFVWQPSTKETRDVFQMRRALECMAIDLLLTTSDLTARLTPLYGMVARERMAFERGDRTSWLRLSNAFHVELARLLDNDVLTATLQSLCARTTLIIAYYDTPSVDTPGVATPGVSTPGATACSYIEHQDILDKLSRNDAEGAKAAMHHHLEDCEHRMSEPEKGPVDPWLAFSVKR